MLYLGNKDFRHFEIMNFTHATFQKYFESELLFIGNKYSNEPGSGLFILEYVYLPQKFTIKFDHEKLLFTIKISDSDGGFTFLNKIDDDNNTKGIPNILEKTNIEDAIKHLYDVIKNQKIIFYVVTRKGLRVKTTKQ